jgi:hypothetical protein
MTTLLGEGAGQTQQGLLKPNEDIESYWKGSDMGGDKSLFLDAEVLKR